MWGFLSEFWNAITSVGDYTIEFFENIGKAVAGAIGSMFEFLIHTASDFVIFVSWTFDNLWNLTGYILQPIKFIFHFLKKFFISVFTPENTPEQIWAFSDEVIDVFNSIPYWKYFSVGIGAVILLFIAFKVIKKLERI